MAAPPEPASAARDPRTRAAVHEYLLKEKDDEVVLAFGSDYFHGARSGSGCGGLFTGAWSICLFRRMKMDQREADTEVGLKPGQRNPNFSRWVLVRGLRSQPMLAVGCYALFATTLFKAAKFYLSHRRCVEFLLDDVEFAMLERMSREDPVTRELFDKLCAEGVADGQRPQASSGTTTKAAKAEPAASSAQTTTAAAAFQMSMSSLNAAGGSGGTPTHRRSPTYWDGVAVGLMGSIMDCYVPMKPMWTYYNMRFGMM